MSQFAREILQRIHYWRSCDRIGPDIPWTHWRLYFRTTMLELCKSKFKYFDSTAEFRPGAFAIGCSNIYIGGRVVIRPGVCLHGNNEGEEIRIEDDVLMGQYVHIYVDNHRFSNPAISIIDQGFEPSEPVVLRKGCWIGANAIILPGVVIGQNSLVGAGSIVTKSVPDHVVAAGNPARIIREIK